MGLDIVAYKNIKEVLNSKLDKEGDPINYNEWCPARDNMEWSEKKLPGIGSGVDCQKIYTSDESFGFRAGSYEEYYDWIDLLKIFRNNGAFQELINFKPCSGVIGSVIALKLAKEFLLFNQDAKVYAESLCAINKEQWLKTYYNFKKAFEVGSISGAVSFH